MSWVGLCACPFALTRYSSRSKCIPSTRLDTDIKHHILVVTTAYPGVTSSSERMQRRVEDASEAEYDTDAPPHKRRKLSRDSRVQQYTETSYENTQTHGNARAHYGNVFNYIGQTPPSSTPHMSSSPGFQDHQNGAAGAASWIKALRFEHIDSHFTSIRAAHTGTCEWLFANKVYEEWRDSSQAHVHHGFLWVKGKPGAGKSTLMKYAYLRGQKIHANDATLSHFFSARRSLLHCSAEGMLSLIHI